MRSMISLVTIFFTSLFSAPSYADQPHPDHQMTIERSIIGGDQVTLFHQPPSASQPTSWYAKAGGYECEINSVNQEARGGASVVYTIVIDRGGPGQYEMGPQGDAIREGLKTFLKTKLTSLSRQSFKVIDLAGGMKSESDSSQSSDPLITFLDSLPKTEQSGSNVYGASHTELADLIKQSAPLMNIIMITDGVDPSMGQGSVDEPHRLKTKASSLGVRIHTFFVDKRKMEGISIPKTRSFSRAENLLGDISLTTKGRFKRLETNELSQQIYDAMDEITSYYEQLHSSTCTFCSQRAHEAETLDISLGYQAAGKAYQSPVTSQVITKPNQVKPCVIETVGKTCSQDAQCLSCEVCQEGHCTAPVSCKENQECAAGCECTDGVCQPGVGKKIENNLGLIIGGVIALLVFLVFALKLRAHQRKSKSEIETLRLEAIKNQARVSPIRFSVSHKLWTNETNTA